MPASEKTDLRRWQFCVSGSSDWREAVVPGHVHCDLMRHGLIADPFVRENEKDCQWVDDRDWSYRCVFDWSSTTGLPRRVLRFEGLDTICSVFLNGEKIAEHDSMFVVLEIDVSSLLHEGANELRVDFLSAVRIGLERKAAYLASHGLAGDTPNFDERAFVRKAQYMFGWDWGPRLVSCGIWKPVVLVESADGGDRTDRTDQADRTDTQRCELVQKADAEGASFEFLVDGKPFYALGANWIPDHSFPSQVSRERYRERLQQAKDLGINMLRVWGGGIYEDDAFYEICDELGILVWQDFMFACSYYPDDAAAQDEIRREAEYQICRLRHHPCIAIWCGNNECHQVWQDGWGGRDKQPPRFHGEVLYHEVLRDAVTRLDPDRPYWPGSPYSSDSLQGQDAPETHGLEGRATADSFYGQDALGTHGLEGHATAVYCNSGKNGDQHYWDVWHGRGDWTYYRESDARFCSEFGFMSSPSAATWARAGIDISIDKEDPVARVHNKTGKPFNVIMDVVRLHYPEAKTLDEWSYYSQLNQRDAMRAAIEHYRFSGRCRGALLWQLNDCWPVESWSVLEFGGRKKAAAYELPRLFSPLLLSLTFEEGEVILRAILHNASDVVKAEFKISGWSIEPPKQWFEADGLCEVGPEEIKEVFRCPAGSVVFWVASFGEAMVCAHCGIPKGVQEPRMEAEVQGKDILIRARGVILDAYLEDANNPGTTFEPNYICAAPGERIAVRASHPVSKLSVRSLLV